MDTQRPRGDLVRTQATCELREATEETKPADTLVLGFETPHCEKTGVCA